MDTNKKIRMKDIADKLGISINAVSLALSNKVGVSDETRMKVLKAADGLGYLDQYPSLSSKRHFNNICVMLEERIFKDTRFYPRVILGIENEAKKNNYDTLVSFINRDDFQVPSCIEKGKADGIIILGHIPDDSLNMLKSYRMPLVLVDYASYSVNSGAVLTQNIPGAYLATKYLIENGHREIGFFGEKDMTLSFNERWIGFNEAMNHYGIPVKPEYNFTKNIDENALKNNYMDIVELIKDIERFPTAWFCANDGAAVVLINALRHLGRNVPEDISVVGFDDIDLCKMVTPQLTTMRVEMKLMGILAFRELLWYMGNMQEPRRHIRMAVNLVERETVRKID
jgi:LacI family transcriptional regulator